MSVHALIGGVSALFTVSLLQSQGATWYNLSLALVIFGNAWLLGLFYVVRFSLKTFIRRSSDARRAALLRAVESNKAEFKAKKSSPKSDDGDWEHVHDSSKVHNKRQPRPDPDFNGIIGFFHPFANAGGGGERVLWAAVKATQDIWPNAVCVIYTGDQFSSKAQILERVKSRFSIDLYSPTVLFLYLSKRDWVVAGSYPRFTLLLQSLGSVLVAHEALAALTPDIFIDTMGYAFSTWYCKFLFPHIAVGSYVHYPFIGTHMVESLTSDSGHGVNAGTGRGLRGVSKKIYWHSLLRLYACTGTAIDSVMTNSSWTQAHMERIWGPGRSKKGLESPMVVYPPCSVVEIIDQVPLEGPHALPRENILLCVAQFRPEKNHELLIEAFAAMDHTKTNDAKLVLVGSVRDSDDETLVYKLRLLAKELKVGDQVDFRINVLWDEILDWLKRSSVGVNGMWCEHFGIGVVEYQAAGLFSVVNNSGGPKEDIVVPLDGGSTGYHASTVAEYSECFTKALNVPSNDVLEMRKRARESSKRFTTSVFEEAWSQQMSLLRSCSRDAQSKTKKN